MISSSEHSASEIRIKCLDMVHRSNASHIGSCLSVCDILAVLYEHLRRKYKIDSDGIVERVMKISK